MSPSKVENYSLDAEQIRRFQTDGYLIIPDFFDATPVLSHAKRIINSFSLEGHPLTKFSTGGDDGKESDKHVGDRYFLESGDKVRFFLEEDAVGADGQLKREPARSVNKCGHALHALDPAFHDFSFSPKLQGLARSLGIHDDPRVLQSMIICKQPSIGGAVPPHNDSTFLYTSPPSAVGFWFALEDCTRSNGCLSFIPGSHRWSDGHDPPAADPGVERPRRLADLQREAGLGEPRGVNKRFVRSQPGDASSGTTFDVLSSSEEVNWDDELARVEECKAGTLVLIHGSVMHKSEKNLSPISRFIYTFHMIEGNPSLAKYDDRNWLQPTKTMPFSKLYDPPPVVNDGLAH